MSEPVTNTEIEDVLSSIRRLISDNPGKGGEGDTPAASADKLVLTPAFRVLDGDGREMPEGAPEGKSEADNEPNAQQADAEPAPVADMPAESGNGSATQSDGLEQRIAELEAAIGETYEEWEPDGSEYEDGDAVAGLHPTAEAPAQWDVVEEADAPGATITAMDAPAGIVLEAEEVFDEEDTEEDEEADEEFVLDEEMLREMVSQLVREQLKGQIGEKITRSIRRMVRREIRLALAVRDTE